MKKKIKVLTFLLSLLLVLSFSFTNIVYANANEIYLGGFPAGFSLSTNGAYVAGLCDVVTPMGIVSPSKEADIKVGDLVMNIDGNKINDANDIEDSIKNKDEICLQLKRCNDIIIKTVKPAKDIAGNFKLGLFVRKDVCGIGTVTFIKDGRIASLGHPVIGDNGEILEINSGSVFECNVTGYVKGERGRAGELRGVFLKTNSVATIDKNLISGVYGQLNDNYNLKSLQKIEVGTAKPGDAKIYTTIDGNKPSEYSISIVKVDNLGEYKNYVIKINDKNLLDNTGGIVQGMSGSPIVQNGKLVGAVTHVFLNDPTRGFGISIDNMINN